MTGAHARRNRRLRGLFVSLIGVALLGVAVEFTLEARGEPAHDTAATFAASPSPTPTPTPPRSTTPAPAPAGSATPTPLTAPPSVERPSLVVLNSTTVRKLANRAADEFTATGWRVTHRGNYRPRLEHTTVFYGEGQDAVARELAAAFPGITSVEPKPAAMGGAGLTVVLGLDWPR